MNKLVLNHWEWECYKEAFLKKFPDRDVDAHMNSIFVKALSLPIEEIRLGSLEQQLRVERHPEISRIRGLRYIIDPVQADKTHHTSETYDLGKHSSDAPKWVEHGMFRPRDVPPCFPGKV